MLFECVREREGERDVLCVWSVCIFSLLVEREIERNI